MLRKEQNELLARCGSGTPMDNMFRASWQPALLAEELPENDCPPVRVKLLSERLMAWRDSQGRYALHDEFCAHRGVSLWFGRNERGGLRCPYHGWKYDHTGQCVEVPSEPGESGFCKKIKLAVLSVGRTWRHSMGLYGAARRAAAIAGVGICADAGGSPFCIEAPAGIELAPGNGRRDRIPATYPFSIPVNSTATHYSKARRATNTISATPSRSSRSLKVRAASYRRTPQRRERQLLLANHTMGDACLHNDPPARRPSGSRTFLGADRRRELLGLEL